MKKGLLAMSLVVAAVLCSVVVMAEAPETITLDDCMSKKSAVEFPHAAHWEVTVCGTCHHTQAELTADTADSAKPCSECHVNPEAAETPACGEMSLKKNPFHISCVGCHKEEAAGPQKCDDCHTKAEG